MAERRMFAKTIIDSDAFLDMPLSTQALYFHLSMRADDEGFVNNPKMIMRTIGASTDDLKVLMTKQFVLTFETGIIVIKHWKIHNYIRADRLNETACSEEKAMLDVMENGEYQLLGTELIDANDTATKKRKIAYKVSSLPYSFTYKISRAFSGKTCPVCGFAMSGELRKPTVQHNLPISKGGEHELDNISVICRNCNVSIQDNETEPYNNAEVIEVWDKIEYAERNKIKWFENPSVLDNINVSQMSVKCQSNDSIGKVRLGKDRLGEDRLGEDRLEPYFPFPEVEDAFQEFLKIRKKLKAVNSDRAINSLVSKINEYSNGNPGEAVKIIEQSIENSWKGIFPMKGSKQQTSSSQLDAILNA